MTGYPVGKLFHMPKFLADGAVSAICFSKDRPINLRLSSWSRRAEDVTCPRCKKKMAALHLSGQV